MSDQGHERLKPYSSAYPLPISGKGVLSADGKHAYITVWWFGGLFATRDIRKAVMAYVRNCYPEAEGVKLWTIPGKSDRVRVTFDIGTPPKRKGKRKGQEIDWSWRYE